MINKEKVNHEIFDIFSAHLNDVNATPLEKLQIKKTRMDISFDLKNYLFGILDTDIQIFDNFVESNFVSMYGSFDIQIKDEKMSLRDFVENIDRFIDPINREEKLNGIL